jgi:hypothetical protein
MRSGCLALFLMVSFQVSLLAQTSAVVINSITPNQSAYCVSDSISISFTTINFAGSNTFTARISKSGFAADSTTIGSITFSGNQANATIVYHFQIQDADADSAYQLRIRSGATASALFPSTPFTVNARPVAAASINTQTVCSGVSTAAITFSTSNNVANTTYAWSRNDTSNVSGPVSGNGNIPATVLTNNTLTNQTVTYTITPSGPSACAGNPISTTVIVLPAPMLTLAYTDSVCSQSGFNVTLSSTLPSGYFWFASDNPLTVGEDIGTQTSSSFTDTVTNLSAVDQMVSYYAVAISNSGGCQSSVQTADIVIRPRPAVTNDTALAVCSGIPLILPLTSNVAAGFTWRAAANASVTGESTTLQTSDTISNTLLNTTTAVQTVVYTITLTGVSGVCAANPHTLLVRVQPNPVANFTIANPTAQCERVNSFRFTATQNAAITQYLWTFGGSLSPSNDTGALVIQNFTGTGDSIPVMLITSTASGCKDSLEKAITIYPAPDAAFSLSDTTPCSGDTISFAQLDTANTTSLIWVWGDGSANTTCTACIEAQHRYSSSVFPSVRTMKLIATSPRACRDTSVVLIVVKPNPDANFTVNDNTQCLNGGNQQFIFTDRSTIADSINNPMVYSWDFADNSPLDSAKDASHSYALADSYFVYQSLISPFGCRDSIYKLVIVYPDPHTAIRNSNGSDTLCGGTRITLTADSGYAYLWSNGRTTRSITVLDSVLANSYIANYLVTVTDNHQCTASASRPITINAALAAPVIAYDTALIFCAGAKAQLFQIANPLNAAYTWTTVPPTLSYSGSQLSFDLPNLPGDSFSIYVVAIDNSTACSSRDSAVIHLSSSQAPQADVVLDLFTLICTNNTVNNYQWGFDDSSFQEHRLSGETLQSYYVGADPDVTVSGKYYWVKITDAGGCQSKIYYQSPPGYLTGIISGNADGFAVRIYPNPAIALFKVEISNNSKGNIMVEISNTAGQVIFRDAYRSQMIIDAGKWTNGIYLLKIISSNGVYQTQRIVKM